MSLRTDDQKLSCEGELSAAECFESLKTMEMGRSPGTDGLPAEFYYVLWNDVSTYLLASLDSSFSKGDLSISQRRGLITLISKKNKPQQCFKKQQNVPGMLLFIDFKKVFDTLEWKVLEKNPSLLQFRRFLNYLD